MSFPLVKANSKLLLWYIKIQNETKGSSKYGGCVALTQSYVSPKPAVQEVSVIDTDLSRWHLDIINLLYKLLHCAHIFI